MKTLRIILIILLILYGLGSLAGAIFSLFLPAKQAEMQQLGEMTPGLEKLLLLSGAMLAGQTWLYFSAIALLVTKMKEGYMYAVTLGFIELIQAIVIVIALHTHNFGSATDYLALLKGILLLSVALVAFKKIISLFMSAKNPKVDFYFIKAKKWQEELMKLRTIVLRSGLVEELKWGCPCYTSEKKNIVLIHAFKEYCALLFFKGALLKDPKGILIQQTENVQSGRQLRFTKTSEVTKLEKSIKSFIREAVKAEEAGLKVPLKKTKEFKMAEEFQNKLNEIPELKTAFKALTPGRQRGYLLYFSSAKQSKTREARINKSLSRILLGKGLLD